MTWSGLDSFMAELQTLTADLVDEANAIMVESAEAAKRDIAAAYPHKTGTLRRGLVLKPAQGHAAERRRARADRAARLHLRARDARPREQGRRESRPHEAESDVLSDRRGVPAHGDQSRHVPAVPTRRDARHRLAPMRR